MEKAIFDQEASRLKEVRKVLQITIDESVQKLELQQDKLVEERRRMWEECAHGVSDYDDIIVMNQYDETVREEQGHYVRRDEERRQLQYLMEKGYFGRIDFIESGESLEEKIYIGRVIALQHQSIDMHLIFLEYITIPCMLTEKEKNQRLL